MDKKNLCPKSLVNNKNNILGYTVPKYHEGKKCYVDFFAYDPARDKMARVKKHFDSIRNKKQRRLVAEDYISKTIYSLSHGWNPWISDKTDRNYTLMSEVLDNYLVSLKRYDRMKTYHNYSSRCKILREYLDQRKNPCTYAYEFNKNVCVDFLDWLFYERDVNPRTVNNYRGWLSSLSSWMIERKYIETNPAEGIKKLQETEKIRKAISPDDLKRIFKHLMNTDKYYLLAVLFEYYTFIRPTELSHIKIGDISVIKQSIFIPGTVSKNRHDGMVSINSTLMELMIELKVLEKPVEFYLFGPDFRPSPERTGPDKFNKRWATMRKVLNLPNNIMFYSLKDSGIRDLANKKGVVVARDQARHTDIATTNRYLQGRDLSGPNEAKDFTGFFD